MGLDGKFYEGFKIALRAMPWNEYSMGGLFHITKGKRLTKADIVPGNINFLGAIRENNGVREKIETDYAWQPN